MMRPVLKYGLFILITGIGCDSENIPPDHEENDINHITDGFCIEFGDSIIINHEEIDYYDFSTHIIYLKEPHKFLQDNYNWEVASLSFSVYAHREKIYTGSLISPWTCSLPSGPYMDFPFGYPGYFIKINNISEKYYYQDNSKPDQREDEKIVNVLKAYNQFHAGLSCSIDEIEKKSNGQLSFLLTIVR